MVNPRLILSLKKSLIDLNLRTVYQFNSINTFYLVCCFLLDFMLSYAIHVNSLT